MVDNKMFCFQCEQTAACTACTGAAGVCGKPFDVAFAQDELTGALVGLSRTELAAGKRSNRADQLIVDGLFTCITNVNFDKAAVDAITAQVRDEKNRLAAEAGVEPSTWRRLVRQRGHQIPQVPYSLWYPRYGCLCLSRSRSWKD